MATIRRDLKQRDFERFEELYNEYGINDLAGASRIAGKIVQAALLAGWLEGDGLTAEGIPDMPPGEVRKLSNAINRYYVDAGKVDSNLS